MTCLASIIAVDYSLNNLKCWGYRVCDTGGYPMDVDTQDEKLREIQYRNFI